MTTLFDHDDLGHGASRTDRRAPPRPSGILGALRDGQVVTVDGTVGRVEVLG